MAWVISFCTYFIGYFILLPFQHLSSIYFNVASSLISYRYAGSVFCILKEVRILHILLTALCSGVVLTPRCRKAYYKLCAMAGSRNYLTVICSLLASLPIRCVMVFRISNEDFTYTVHYSFPYEICSTWTKGLRRGSLSSHDFCNHPEAPKNYKCYVPVEATTSSLPDHPEPYLCCGQQWQRKCC